MIVAGLIILALKKGLFTAIAGILRPLLRAEPQKKGKGPLAKNSFQDDPRHRTVACRYPGRVSHIDLTARFGNEILNDSHSADRGFEAALRSKAK